jgi:hypothetical protein
VPDRRAPIRYGEWLKAVRSDPEMRMSRSENKGLAVWVGHPDRKKIRFDLCGRSIVVESPDGPIIGKLREISGALDARAKNADEER